MAQTLEGDRTAAALQNAMADRMLLATARAFGFRLEAMATGLHQESTRLISRRQPSDSFADGLCEALGDALRQLSHFLNTGEPTLHALRCPETICRVSYSQGSGFDSLREHHMIV